MAKRTQVWIHALSGISDDEARRVLGGLREGPFGPVEVWRSDAPGAPLTLFLSFDGDVRQSMQERLAQLTSLPFAVDVMTNDAP